MYKHEYMDKMRQYFEDRNTDIESGLSPRQIKMAGLPALALELGITVSEIKGYESSDGAAAEFYVDMITRYEAICDRYGALGMMTEAQRKRLNETVFASVGGGNKQDIALVFPKWNAPDDYEHFKKARAACDDTGVMLSQIPGIVRTHARQRSAV